MNKLEAFCEVSKGFYITILAAASVWLIYAISEIGFHWANIMLIASIIFGIILLLNNDY